MSAHLVVGAGPVGSALTEELLRRGEEVRIATRSGATLPGAESRTLDAADAAALTAAAEGARTIHVCTNPPYHRWETAWPPIVRAVIAAAEATGAAVVQMGNLYSYGRPDGAMTPGVPERPTETKGRVRQQMTSTYMAAHEAGRIRFSEVRASDYFGPGAGAGAHFGPRFVDPLREGRATSMIGDPDVPHAIAYLPDIARSLAETGTRDDLLGRILFPPHAGQEPARAFAARILAAAGLPDVEPRVRQMPPALLTGLSWFSPMLREIRAVRYQHTEPYLVDDSSSCEALGFGATPIDEAVSVTVHGAAVRP